MSEIPETAPRPPIAPERADETGSLSGGAWGDDTREMTRARETSIGPYRVLYRIGSGGMGIVYKAHDAKLDRHVAIKVLKEKLAGNERYLKRLSREARAVASLSHPAVIQIYAFEDGSGPASSPRGGADHAGQGELPFLVMEYVEGESIEARLKRGEVFSSAAALDIAAEAARGLRAAQSEGIIHRDIKPSNILIRSDGAVKIVDFGLAKEIDSDGSITDEGMVLGTPHYISPEQGQGRKVDHRSDIYSLGATLYHMVTGQPVFEGDSHASVIYAHVHTPPRPPHELRLDVPPAVSAIIGKMLAKDPEQRYAGYDALIADFEASIDGRVPGRETVRSARRTYRRQRPGTRAAFWFLCGLAAWSGLALLIVGLLTWIEGRETQDSADAALRLLSDRALLARDPASGRDVLELNFQSIAAKQSVDIDKLFAAPGGRRPPPKPVLSQTGGLGFPAGDIPYLLRLPFSNIDEIVLSELRLKGFGHLGVALCHPDGQVIRKFWVTLGGGDERGTRIENPLTALRHGASAALDPAPAPLDALGNGTFDVSLRFQRDGERTRIWFTVRRHRREPAQGPVVYPRPGQAESFVVEGTDWNRGLLVLEPHSPIRPVLEPALARLKVVGTLDRERKLIDLDGIWTKT
jgi:hypothetical protein